MTSSRASSTSAFDAVYMTEQGAVGIKAIGMAEPYLSGHFPGNPIYPGVFQIDLCEKLIRECTSDCEGFDRIDQIKFVAAVVPGERLRIDLTLRRDDHGVIDGADFVGRRDLPDAEVKFTMQMSRG